jgi:hypothetical protein
VKELMEVGYSELVVDHPLQLLLLAHSIRILSRVLINRRQVKWKQIFQDQLEKLAIFGPVCCPVNLFIESGLILLEEVVVYDSIDQLGLAHERLANEADLKSRRVRSDVVFIVLKVFCLCFVLACLVEAH